MKSNNNFSFSFHYTICAHFSNDLKMCKLMRLIVDSTKQTKKIQTNKQKISSIKVQNSDYVDDKGQCELNYSRILQRWTSEEISLAVKGFQKYGKNFQVKTHTHTDCEGLCYVHFVLLSPTWLMWMLFVVV